jgi:hypothetical protein
MGIDDSVAMIIQIRLAQFNLEAAEKELNAAKSWAQDSLLAQLAEVILYSKLELIIGMGGVG